MSSDKIDSPPADDDVGERVSEDVLVTRVDAVSAPAAAATPTTWDANGGRVRDEDADLYFGNGNDVDLFSENNDRENQLYGNLLPWKRQLQRAGFSVWYCTAKGAYANGKATNWLNVGSQIISVAELRPMAERHARDAARKAAA
jgi:hypothetical protein